MDEKGIKESNMNIKLKAKRLKELADYKGINVSCELIIILNQATNRSRFGVYRELPVFIEIAELLKIWK